MKRRLLLATLALALSPACLVLSVNPAYDGDTVTWEPGLDVIFDQKENALIGSSTRALRDWLRRQPPNGRMFGAPAVFARKT